MTKKWNKPKFELLGKKVTYKKGEEVYVIPLKVLGEVMSDNKGDRFKTVSVDVNGKKVTCAWHEVQPIKRK